MAKGQTFSLNFSDYIDPTSEKRVVQLTSKDQFNHQNHDDLIVEQGQRDIAEDLGIPCPIDPGSLLQPLRNALKGGEKDDGVEADPPPLAATITNDRNTEKRQEP